MVIRAYRKTVAGHGRFVVMSAADFDLLLAKSGLTGSTAPLPARPRLEDFPPEVEDHLDTEVMIRCDA